MASLFTGFVGLRSALGVAAVWLLATVTGCSAAPGDAASSDADEALTTGFGAFVPNAEPKNGQASDMNLTNAYWMAYSTFALYAGDAPAAERYMRATPNFKPIVFQTFFDTATSAMAYYARSETFAILAYRGTDFSDFHQYEILGNIGITAEGGGSAYSGFVGAFHNMWFQPGEWGYKGTNDIRTFIAEDEAKAHVPLYITGHSLGGAFATLAASNIVHDPQFMYEGKSILSAVYTYGSPRVGTADFSDEMTTLMHQQGVELFRVVLDLDLVPDVIPCWPLTHPGAHFSSIADYFQHLDDDSYTTHEADDLVWLDKNGVPFFGEDAQKKLDFRWIDELGSTDDHVNYVTILERHQ